MASPSRASPATCYPSAAGASFRGSTASDDRTCSAAATTPPPSRPDRSCECIRRLSFPLAPPAIVQTNY